MFDVFYFNNKPNLFAHEREVKSVEEAQELSRTRFFWIVDYLCDYSDFDFLWEPKPWEAHQRHVYASQWQKDSGTCLYPKTGYTDTQYHAGMIATRKPATDNWDCLGVKGFDYSWHPDPTEPPLIYVFGTQHQKTGGPTYTVPGATTVKYVKENRVNKTAIDSHWEDTSFEGFDYTWHPDATEEPYIYQFGTQWQKTHGPRYSVPGAKETKYVNTGPRYNKTNVDTNWESLDYDNFDFTWHPDATEDPMNYQFGTQWQKTGGPLYTMPGATETKYVNKPRHTRTSVDEHWNDTSYDFDYSWHPDSTEEPYIYQFGTQWQKTGGPQYTVPGATTVKYVNQPRVIVRDFELDNWEIPAGCTSEDFDFTWTPDTTEEPYVYQFGTQHQKTGGPRYIMPGASIVKYISEPRMTVHDVDMSHWTVPDTIDSEQFDFTWHPDATEEPYNYQFGTQWQKTGGPLYTMPGATVTKYVKHPRAVRTEIDDNWEIPNAEFGEFDYTWHPDATENAYNYQFGTQWQKTGGPLYKQAGATQTKYVEQVKAESIAIARDVYFIDHGNPEAEQVVKQLEAKGCNVKKRSRFIASYKGTLQRILSREEAEYMWVCSSVCDYSDFDFSWHPEQWQGTMLHVFASGDQQFGDTFLVNVPSFNDRIAKTEVLEWYNTLHFVDDIQVPRWPIPVVINNGNSIVEDVQQHTFNTPLALFASTDDIPVEVPTVSLWREKTRTITPITRGNSVVVVPRDAKTAVLKELYDYPFIDTKCSGLMKDKPLDIVFISNGEKNAKENWSHLQRVTADKPNRVVRVDGVNGRAAAYKAAANASNTPWFFAVFAKLTVDENFDWSWQPDRLQINKHYIFHAQNPVNGLEYGHMAMIAYHKDLVLENQPTGLDFTLDQEHEVVPVLSGVANYADDVWTAWRSAFREVLKLRNDQTTIDNQYRLKIWTTRGEGAIGEWSVKGACDAVEYWEAVNGDFNKLKLSYEWAWLREYFVNRYGFEPDQQ